MSEKIDLTDLLHRWQRGEIALEGELMETIYPELRTLATHYLSRQGRSVTLQTTDLVNEAFLRITRLHNLNLNDRHHFYAIAAKAVRGIVIDRLRRGRTEKWGRGLPFMPLEHADTLDRLDNSVDWLAVDQALCELERADPQCGQVVELKFFVGLDNCAIAETLGVSESTIVRRWRFAKAWLHSQLTDHGEDMQNQ